MADVTTMFWDLGGVLLSNGWDRNARAAAMAEFGLDAGDFERRHQRTCRAFECGRLSMDDYLADTVFHQPRAFAPKAFGAYMLGQSTGDHDMLDFVRGIAATQRHLMLTLNNESAELNRHRIQTFGLAQIFSAFFSSCYLGLVKPDAEMYQKALQLTQRHPGECLLIDDRLPNVLAARGLGMQAIHFTGLATLRPALDAVGV